LRGSFCRHGAWNCRRYERDRADICVKLDGLLHRRARRIRRGGGDVILQFSQFLGHLQNFGNGFFNEGQSNQRFDNKGFDGGGQAGCQLQTGAVIWGLEGDWSSFNKSDSHAFSSGFNQGGVLFNQSFNQSLSYSSLASIRGRWGIVLADVYHLYATAGVGGTRTRYANATSVNINQLGLGSEAASTTGNFAINPTGFVIGAGAEWRIWSNVIVGAEYLHYALASDTVIPFNTGTFGALLSPVELGDHVTTSNVDVVRLRASWLFNFGH
jgi:opacity protein-like surface antigen